MVTKQIIRAFFLITTCALSLAALQLAALPRAAVAEDYEGDPIRYREAPTSNAVATFAARLQAGEIQLHYENGQGYLKDVLKALDVPVSSQTLVFSKTSMQRERITARKPRALYFNDDVYVGFCQEGEVIELSAVDPNLGAVFYTLSQAPAAQAPAAPPQVVRQNDNCLSCHSSSHTKDVPGYVVRSVYAGVSGLPQLAAGTFRTDQTSPLAERWGGWYVTGKHGDQRHLGNFVVKDTVPAVVDNSAGANVLSLSDRFDTSAYPSAHSDIVALMVMEHQVEAHNLITRANFATRQAMHYQQALNRELGEPADHVWDSTKSRIKSACDPLVAYLLFSGEAKLTQKIEGTTSFAQEFAQRGPRDAQGRSLRDLNLETRMFKYPCSYLVYSESFQALPAPAKDYVLRRMWEVLTGQDQSPAFAHLTPADRRATLEILRATMPSLPDYWKHDQAT